jgi:hypothetical protein
MMKRFLFILLFFWVNGDLCGQALPASVLPNTGISGVYEVMVGVNDKEWALRYFKEFGFTPIDSAILNQQQALQIYGVPSALTSIRLQNGSIDSHGLLRLFIWKNPLGEGVGYTKPETIGQRLAVMKTNDIFRITDIYSEARKQGQKWLPTEPIADDLFGLNKSGKNDFFNRPVLVRENAVYGDFFNHVFFQRYGYHIEGYGTINQHAPLKTSEFTHHDFFVESEDFSELSYLADCLGLKAEAAPALNGDWQHGPKQVFQMDAGYSHLYQGFVSPNNICGKLKFFAPKSPVPNRSDKQKLGHPGITLHSFYVPDIMMVHEKVKANKKLKASDLVKNEFNEKSFVFSDSIGCSWQIIEKKSTLHQPERVLKVTMVNE